MLSTGVWYYCQTLLNIGVDIISCNKYRAKSCTSSTNGAEINSCNECGANFSTTSTTEAEINLWNQCGANSFYKAFIFNWLMQHTLNCKNTNNQN